MPVWTEKPAAMNDTVSANKWFPYRSFSGADGTLKFPANCYGFEKVKLGIKLGGFTSVSLSVLEKDADGDFVARDPEITMSGITEDQVVEMYVDESIIAVKVDSVIGSGLGELSLFGVPRS